MALVNFAGGEISPKMWARYDLGLYKTTCVRMENFLAETQGPARFRSGTYHVHHSRGNAYGVFIPFQFNDVQSYLMEFTAGHIRFYKDDGVLVEAAKSITGITQADPGVITVASHGLITGDEIFIDSISGMGPLNGKFFLVTYISANTFSLKDIDGNAINTSSYPAYVFGGTISRVVDVTTPYAEADVSSLQYAQNADVMYIVHKNYAPMKLTRTSATAFNITTYSRTADPFGSAGNYPGAVAFYEGRLVMGGTMNDPETFYLSCAQDSNGKPRYDDFTLTTADDGACCYTFAPEASGKVDALRFFAPTNKFLVAGTFGGMKKITGSTDALAITPKSINVKAVDSFGVAPHTPVIAGGITIYIQRGGLIMRTFEYDWEAESYVSVDRNLIADHITESGVKQIIFQYGDPDVLWCVRNDGKLIGLTFKSREDVSGWHRHIIAGVNAKVISAGILPKSAGHDQLWLLVERTINGKTRRYIEYMTPNYYYPLEESFYTGQDNKEEDRERFNNAMWEDQKRYIHVDAAMTYDGNYRTEGVNVTPAATAGTSVVFTASSAIFTADDVGNQIWKTYVNGAGGGRAIITGYTDSTHVTCNIIKAFDNTSAISAWRITFNTVSGLDHLEGQTVRVITDGAVHPDRVVTGGQITLDYETGTVHIGLGYVGFFQSMNLLANEDTTPTGLTLAKSVDRVGIKFLQSLGAAFGTSLYKMERLLYRKPTMLMNRPPVLFTGTKVLRYGDSFGNVNQGDKFVYVMQDRPLPCSIQMIDTQNDVAEVE